MDKAGKITGRYGLSWKSLTHLPYPNGKMKDVLWTGKLAGNQTINMMLPN